MVRLSRIVSDTKICWAYLAVSYVFFRTMFFLCLVCLYLVSLLADTPQRLSFTSLLELLLFLSDPIIFDVGKDALRGHRLGYRFG